MEPMMGTPALLKDYRAALYDYAGNTISALVRQEVPTVSPILDVGAGWGKYRWLLPEYEMDAVEAWEPNVKDHRLDAYYRNVFTTDMAGFHSLRRYGAVIFGDVLEHLEARDAQDVIARTLRYATRIYVAVPWEMPQDDEEGNPYERHLQADLNATVMAQRYPQLRLYGLLREDGQEHTKAVYIGGQACA